jgi:hypothetical protein
MVKVGKNWLEIQTPLFWDKIPEKMVNQITSPKFILNYLSKQIISREKILNFCTVKPDPPLVF